MTPTVSLRPAHDDDRDYLLRLFATTRGDILGAPLSDEHKTALIEMQFVAQSTDYTGNYPASEHSIIVADETDAGRIWIDRRPDEIRLLDITVAPEHRNRGVGGMLLRRLVDEAQETKLSLRHMVATDNVDALRFYRKLGFEVIDDSEVYVVMEWTGTPS